MKGFFFLLFSLGAFSNTYFLREDISPVHKYLIESYQNSETTIFKVINSPSKKVTAHDFETYSQYIDSPHPTYIHILNKTYILKKIANFGVPNRPFLIPNYLEVLLNSDGFVSNTFFNESIFYSYYSLDFINVCEYHLCEFNGIFYDQYDLGNYVWGAVMRWLKVPLFIATAGAHLNELLGSEHGSIGKLDTQKDQEAISRGYNEGYDLIFKGLNPKLSVEQNYQLLSPEETL